MNKDNIINTVPRISILTQTSAKTGNPYTQLCIHFHSGYVLKTFLNDEQKALIAHEIKDAPKHDSMLDNQCSIYVPYELQG